MITKNQIISEIQRIINNSEIDFNKSSKELETEHIKNVNDLCERILNDNS